MLATLVQPRVGLVTPFRCSIRSVVSVPQTRGLSSRVGFCQRPGSGDKRVVTVIPGDGIGPELCAAAMDVIQWSGAPIEFDEVVEPPGVVKQAMKSLRETGVGIKGEFMTHIGRNTPPSPNKALITELDLFADVVHAFELPGNPKARHSGIDIVIIRENTEGEYSGMEHEVVPGVCEALKVMTAEKTERIANYAFEYALMNKRKKVTAVHKANIMAKADGLFLDSCAKVAQKYPDIAYEEMIVDNCVMQLISKPTRFDVLVTPNFYGSLVSNVVAGLTGGAGLAPGANIGHNCAIFEQGARHVGRDIAGLDVANPTGILFAAVMMLRHLKLHVFADQIERAVFDTIKANESLTLDMGGTSPTSHYLDAVISRLR